MGMRQFIMIAVLMVSDCFCEDFISDDEYAEMLYKNPRGIGCDKCHGINGEGLVLSQYIDKKGQKVEIKAPRIDNIPMARFEKSFKTQSKLMPVYFLTNQEKAYLYYYLTKNQKKERSYADKQEQRRF